MRPHLRLLRHPVLPGQAALPLARGRPGRGRRAAARTADGAPPLREIVLVAQDLASYGRDRTGPGRRTRIADGPSPIAALTRAVSARVERTRLLYLYPSGLTDELIEAVLATGVPYFDLSLQHVSRPLLAAHAPLGRRRALPAPHRRHPGRRARRHLPLLVHPRLPRRDRARPRPAPRVPRRRRSSTGPASSPSPTRTAPTPPASPTRCRPSSRSSACASAPSCRTPSPRPSATRSSARRARSSSTRPAGAARCTRRPRSTASCTCPTDLAVGSLVDVHHHRRGGPRPARRPGRPTAARSPAGAGAAPVSDATHEPTRARGLHLRPERAGHAGQRRHRGPAARRAGLRR